jgi:3-deoxy-D-manno-octulosonate 8-phosphate phosphatase (KDO 8-P phosphatase)
MPQRKRLTAKSALKPLKKIKVLVLDIDGVLTDSRLFYVEGTGWGAFYSVMDGFGIKLLKRNGIEVCFISAGTFTSHRKRAEILGIRHAYFGDENKLVAFEKIQRDLGVKASECAFMGDELFDIPVLRSAGFAATPPHSPAEVKKECDYVTKKEGGHGAVREICDLLLAAHGKQGYRAPEASAP